MGRDCKREKRGKKNWAEINIKKKEREKTVKERREEETGVR